MSDSTPSKKWRLKPRKIRREAARAKGVAFVPQYNFTSGPNRAERRAMVKMGRLLFNKGLWVRELAIALRGMLRRMGAFDGQPTVFDAIHSREMYP